MGANIVITELHDALHEDEISRISRNFFKWRDIGASVLNSCDHGTYFTGGEVPAHVHENTEEIFYFIRGNGVMVLDGKEVPVKAGSVVPVPARVVTVSVTRVGIYCSILVCSARLA